MHRHLPAVDVGRVPEEDTPWLYIVHTDIPDDIVDEYNDWYDREHLPMGKASLAGATGLASHRIVGSPAGKSPFARLTEITFPSLKVLQECAALPAAQKTMANAVEISTGGAPHFMILEQEG